MHHTQWELSSLPQTQQVDLFQISDDGSRNIQPLKQASCPLNNSYQLMGNPTIADAVLGRRVNNAHIIQLRWLHANGPRRQELTINLLNHEG